MLDRFQVARLLREIAALLSLRGENPFKVRAYEAAAGALEEQPEELSILVAEERLTVLSGVGDALAAKIGELHRTGKLGLLDALRSEFPAGLLALATLPEVGPKKAAALHAALGISSVAQLQAACEAGQVRGVKGFGEQTEARILDGIRRFSTRDTRVLLFEALAAAEPLLAYLRSSPAVLAAEPGGSLRRSRETVADLDLVTSTRDGEAVMDHFARYPQVERVESRGPTKSSVRLGSGLQVDLRAVTPEDFATTLHHFTGSKEHHVRLRGLARERGLSLSEYGLAPIDGGEKLAVTSEAELYERLGLPFIPPEMREGWGEIDAAHRGDTFADLVTFADLRGVAHAHTVHSDGKNTIEEMAIAAKALGLEYLTITDHSPTASYAHGVGLDRLQRQWEEIDEAQEKTGIRILKGTESDILEDGSLDYPDAVLEQFEVIIASIHMRHRMDEAQMTARLRRAMALPVFKIWGHPLGRLLQEREPIECRMEELLEVIASSRAAIEVNGHPLRLDLEPRWIRRAREYGIPFVLSADAHSADALSNVRFALAMARRGGLRRHEVLNTLAPSAFLAAVRPGA